MRGARRLILAELGRSSRRPPTSSDRVGGAQPRSQECPPWQDRAPRSRRSRPRRRHHHGESDTEEGQRGARRGPAPPPVGCREPRTRPSSRRPTDSRSASSSTRSAPVVRPIRRHGSAQDRLTTQQGVPVADDQNTLRAGGRGPALLEDFHFREKIFHFDHERIPERVVHARGFGAHGFFEPFESLADLTRADLFQRPGERTPVFVRFSTVAGNKGSFDLARDVRGFAVKFYTQEGNWDLVGNNIPVFFIQDAIKFPDLVHSVKQAPDRGLPAGTVRPRQLLGLHLPDARGDPHGHVDDVGPGHPEIVPVHGGLRCPHLPVRERGGPFDLREVPLEAHARPAVGRLERGRQDQRRRPGLPSARPVGRHQQRRPSRVGARRAAVRRRLRRPLRLRRPRRHQADPRGARAGASRRPARARPHRRQLLRRDRAGGLLHAERRSRHRLHERSRCCRAATSRTWTPS